MRRPSRNIEIFSMSVLDMFGSALGAFILISVILFPFYNQSGQVGQQQQKLDEVTENLKQAREQIQRQQEASKGSRAASAQAIQVKTQIEECNKSMSLCRIAQAQPFLVVGKEWKEG